MVQLRGRIEIIKTYKEWRKNNNKSRCRTHAAAMECALEGHDGELGPTTQWTRPPIGGRLGGRATQRGNHAIQSSCRGSPAIMPGAEQRPWIVAAARPRWAQRIVGVARKRGPP